MWEGIHTTVWKCKGIKPFLSEMYTLVFTVAMQKLYSSVISLVAVLKSRLSTGDSQIGIMYNCFFCSLHRDPEAVITAAKPSDNPALNLTPEKYLRHVMLHYACIVLACMQLSFHRNSALILFLHNHFCFL